MPAPQKTSFLFRPRSDQCSEIAVSGLLDESSVSALRVLLEDMCRHGVTLDLTECSGVTAEALTGLAFTARIAEAHGGFVRLRPSDEHDAPGSQQRDVAMLRGRVSLLEVS